MNQTNVIMTNQPGASVPSTQQSKNTAGTDTQNSQFTQIIQQVAQLKDALHNFIEQEDFPDATVISASSVLEEHLSHYHQLAAQKENMKPGLHTF